MCPTMHPPSDPAPEEKQEHKYPAEMTMEDMKRIVDEARDIDFYAEQNSFREWRVRMRDKAPAIVSLLQQHLPPEVLREVGDFLSNPFGCKCVQRVLTERPPDDVIASPDTLSGDDAIPF
jgi:hypothetical protein